ALAQRPGRRPIDRGARIERLGHPHLPLRGLCVETIARAVLRLAEVEQIADGKRRRAELVLAAADARLVPLVHTATALYGLAERAHLGLVRAASLARAALVEDVGARHTVPRADQVTGRVHGAELGVPSRHRHEVGHGAGDRAHEVLVTLVGLPRGLPAVSA